MIYMISYDLHAPTNKRDKVMENIESLGVWCKYLTTTYLVKTDYSTTSVISICTRDLDPNDKMIIAPVSEMVNGWLTGDQWKWIRENLF